MYWPKWLYLSAAVLTMIASQTARADLADTIARVKPSIVAVGTYQKTRNPAFEFSGTGFVVGDGTLVVTAAHAVKDFPDETRQESHAIAVMAPGKAGSGQVLAAKAVATDRDKDLALLKVESVRLPALPLRQADDVREGQTFAFTGFALGGTLGYAPVTHQGIVSSITPIVVPAAKGRELTASNIKRLSAGTFPVYQLDTVALSGHSGSPLYDGEKGEVVGIVSMILVRGTKEQALTSSGGIPFAIPVRPIRELIGTIR